MVESRGASAAGERSTSTPPNRLRFDSITFENGRLWRPRYPSLYRYDGMPGLQLEPGFQILSRTAIDVELTFELAAGQGITFVRDRETGGVKCRSLDNPRNRQIPGLAEARWESKTRCTLLWSQATANERVRRGSFQGGDSQTVLRIYCQGGARASELTARERAVTEVEGGLYVAIINRPRTGSALPPIPIEQILGPRPAARRQTLRAAAAAKPAIRVAWIDQDYRPIYDLFIPEPDDVSASLALEPAIRVREGQAVELELALDIPRLLWMTDREEVVVTSPEGRPWQLQATDPSADGQSCRIRWVQQTGRGSCRTGTPDASRRYCTSGYVSCFDLNAIPSPDFAEELVKKFGSRVDPPNLFRDVAIDPTVIEPPACTPDGICIPPGGGRI